MTGCLLAHASTTSLQGVPDISWNKRYIITAAACHWEKQLSRTVASHTAAAFSFSMRLDTDCMLSGSERRSSRGGGETVLTSSKDSKAFSHAPLSLALSLADSGIPSPSSWASVAGLPLASCLRGKAALASCIRDGLGTAVASAVLSPGPEPCRPCSSRDAVSTGTAWLALGGFLTNRAGGTVAKPFLACFCE